MNIGDLPLTKIFWGIFAVEAIVVVGMLLKVVSSIANYKPSDGGLVGAWLVLIPIVALVVVAVLFLVSRAPWARVGCILLLLSPLIAPLVGRPIGAVTKVVRGGLRENGEQRDRRGERIFPKEGQRTLAGAISDRDAEKIKAALPGVADDLNRRFSDHQPYSSPLGDQETFLTFALANADESDAFAEVLRLLIAAGANSNEALAIAIMRSTRAVEMLVKAGADVNADDGTGRPVWWLVLEQGPFGDSDVTRLQLLLSNGADLKKRSVSGLGPIELAVEGERWAAISLLAGLIPGAADVVVSPDGETVRSRLSRTVKGLNDSRQPVPEFMRAALARFDGAAR